MRHRIAGNKLNRNSAWRKATVRDIAKAALKSDRICTTVAKAKEARKVVDKLITLGKKGQLAHKRKAYSILCDHKLVKELFNETSPRFNKRSGGYTRIVPLSFRRGDNAQMAYLELTEKREVIISKAKSAATSKTADLKTADETKPVKAKEPKAKAEAVQEKDTKVIKPNPAKVHPKKIDDGKDLSKSKNFVGKVKQMFRKKPPASK